MGIWNQGSNHFKVPLLQRHSNFLIEMYFTMGGGEFKIMEIEYERA